MISRGPSRRDHCSGFTVLGPYPVRPLLTCSVSSTLWVLFSRYLSQQMHVALRGRSVLCAGALLHARALCSMRGDLLSARTLCSVRGRSVPWAPKLCARALSSSAREHCLWLARALDFLHTLKRVGSAINITLQNCRPASVFTLRRESQWHQGHSHQPHSRVAAPLSPTHAQQGQPHEQASGLHRPSVYRATTISGHRSRRAAPRVSVLYLPQRQGNRNNGAEHVWRRNELWTCGIPVEHESIRFVHLR